ncbi:MAG: BamA/TamA family outer membrane protein [Bacteroidota bacterium]|nr:BamA/TamA family outer membrane protein [Bacteroidota bacterium]MDP4215773.1 BamA/TamA family outer membrane protein [Bacteroidota bacterium]MDP4245706.1 BamA/TamA family outer membrane protein [Bacteroidota bacterium]MDP4256209.1 BamA/TamA family outer membrane protein [Bacteroidota bacterium]MDP4259188.1 BamA/TamA family outer membrane protein [Bacteroidota bacterium]
MKWIALLALVVFFFGCSESKYLGPGQVLYGGNKVRVKSSVKVAHKKVNQVDEELEGLLKPDLNHKILGIRVRLWIYNIARPTNKSKGLKHWIKYKVGEPPVLASPSLIEKNRSVLQYHLENKGWFHDTVISESNVKKQVLTAVYTAQIGPQYTIRDVKYPRDSDALGKRIDTMQRRSLLKKGDPFDLDIIKEERTRIDSRLKQRGFYYFNPDFLQVDVDSAVGGHQVDMQMRIKPETPYRARQIYHINDVIVYAAYDIHSDTARARAYNTPEGYRIIDSARLFKPVIYSRTLVFKPGDLYKRNDHNLSLSRLVSLGVFKFVKARFEPADSTDTNKLDAIYYLTPAKKKSIQFEVSALTRSDNTTGTEFAIDWRNRNFFRGAELFTASVYGGLEEQYVGAGQKVGTRRAGVDIDLYFPRIVAPFPLNTNSAYVPKTKIGAGYSIFERTKAYTLNSATLNYGYIFKNSINTENQLTVFGINYVRPTYIDPAYQKVLDTNITLRRSIEPQLIMGPIYNFNYNSQVRPNRHVHNYYFNGNVDLSGNTLGLLTGANINKGKQVDIFHVPFAQYVRLEADFRHYFSFNKFSMLAYRLTGGVGIAYGNSSTMPFIKEFFAGGTNDIRAFRSRALGPGSYYAGNPNRIAFLPDQPGDVKLETNLEYRTKLFSVVRWALFVDAGNIWTLHPDSSRPGSTFSHNFLNDVAVGVGTGLRFDLSILVLRVDVAVPVRYPWMPGGSKWVFTKATDISNLVLNLAIGYPF